MAYLYYGNGSCSIDTDAIVILITYRGAVEIQDKTPDSFAITAKDDKILIFKHINVPTNLNDLFTYNGEFRIINATASDSSANIIPVTIKPVMDYAELLSTNAEDMTTNSEDLKVTRITRSRVSKTTVDKKTINNLQTKDTKREHYLESGELYEGAYHLHIDTAMIMTGAAHTIKSKSLYLKEYDSTGKPTGKLRIASGEGLRQSRQNLKKKQVHGNINTSRKRRLKAKIKREKGDGYGV